MGIIIGCPINILEKREMACRKLRNASCFPSWKVRAMFILHDGMVIQPSTAIIKIYFISHQVLGSNTKGIPKNSTVDKS